jgi:REP element-mobilizing transposase RayT
MSLPDMRELPVRKRPVHCPPIEYSNRPTIIFLTLCTKGRVRSLACPEALSAMVTAWREASFWHVGRFMVLPDHVHLFCAPATMPPHPLGRWITYWKRLVKARWTGTGACAWQKDFWDTQVRSAKGYEEKWEYVRNNPVRHRLVAAPEHWPYQGQLNVLPWHD